MDPSAPFADLAGRGAVVTGAARGIGLAIAETLQAVGLRVLLIDRDADALAGTATTGGFDSIAASLSDAGCEPLIGQALQSFPPLAVWVNNAGRVSHQAAEDVDIDEFEAVFRDNTASALRGSQLAFRHMPDGGAIVNITSLVSELALPQRMSYATSKAALEHVTRQSAQEWGRHGIRVNAVSPGYIHTRLTAWPADDPRAVAKQAALSELALPREGTVDDIARAVLFLCSSLAGYTTGQTLYVDGGWHIQ